MKLHRHQRVDERNLETGPKNIDGTTRVRASLLMDIVNEPPVRRKCKTHELRP